MTDHETLITSVVVLPKGEPLFSEMATSITIEDLAEGEFVVVSQHGRDLGKIQVDAVEWPAIRAAIDDMIARCRG